MNEHCPWCDRGSCPGCPQPRHAGLRTMWAQLGEGRDARILLTLFESQYPNPIYKPRHKASPVTSRPLDSAVAA